MSGSGSEDLFDEDDKYVSETSSNESEEEEEEVYIQKRVRVSKRPAVQAKRKRPLPDSG